MKTIKLVMLLCVVGLTYTSCKTDDDGGDGGNAAAGTVEATVDGASFTSDAIATMATQINAQGITTLNIVGSALSAGSARTITLTIIGVDGEGTYPIQVSTDSGIITATATYIEASGNVGGGGIDGSWLAPFDESLAGEVNITEITDTTVRGTFSYSARSQDDESNFVEITNGSFNLDL
ncbi:hypothetical protein GCM10011344_19780 [Dokdonia pacifica]|uniref:Uncharacterized protein n=1 Tax=Dokdonia pacifica TaxID=1627892 RepID=A0A238VPW9_9FLAO|nr:DUF6252 family protein [Dokdonia pacifica]GGG19219.1 hypothetical protein GCM10011344_19780 [Dokdonia pacifica]SNR36221.1 hypothetical protein SAMN06265376_101155 [Dokdonia pacifica]